MKMDSIGAKIEELLEYVGVGILVSLTCAVVGVVCYFYVMFALWLLKILAWPIVLGITVICLGTGIGITGYIREQIRRNS